MRGKIDIMVEQKQLPYFDYVFSAGVIIEDVIYFFTEKANVFMKMKIGDWKIECVDQFVLDNTDLHGKTDFLRVIGKKIYRLPLKGEHIDTFTLDNGLYNKIKVKSYNKEWDNFVAFEINGKFLYVFPKWEREVFKIDSSTNKLDSISLILVQDRQNCNEDFISFSCSFRDNNFLWLFEMRSQKTCIFDMNTDTYSFLNRPEEIMECTYFCKVDQLIYCMTLYNEIYVWNTQTNKCSQLWKEERYRDIEYYYWQFLVVNKKIIVLPGYGNDIVIIDICSGTSTQYVKYPKDFIYIDIKWAKYMNCFEDSRYYYYPMRLSEYLMTIDKQTGEIAWNKAIMSWDEKIRYLQKKLKIHPQILYENQEQFVALIEIVNKWNDEIAKDRNLKITIGNMIWRNLKLLLA